MSESSYYSDAQCKREMPLDADIDWFVRQLARLPCSFEVRQPPELRAAVHAHAKRLLALSAR